MHNAKSTLYICDKRILPRLSLSNNHKKKTPRGELDSADKIGSDVCPKLHAGKMNQGERFIRPRDCLSKRIADCGYMKRASTQCIHVSILLFRASVKYHDAAHLPGVLKSANPLLPQRSPIRIAVRCDGDRNRVAGAPARRKNFLEFPGGACIQKLQKIRIKKSHIHFCFRISKAHIKFKNVRGNKPEIEAPDKSFTSFLLKRLKHRIENLKHHSDNRG